LRVEKRSACHAYGLGDLTLIELNERALFVVVGRRSHAKHCIRSIVDARSQPAHGRVARRDQLWFIAIWSTVTIGVDLVAATPADTRFDLRSIQRAEICPDSKG
jgi:hypothetical protein